MNILPGGFRMRLCLLLLWAYSAGIAQSATLSFPVRSGDQFQFNLEGDPYRHYVIQGSSNLQQWTSLTTNVSSLAIRPLSFAVSNSFRFFRSAPFTRTNSLSKAFQTTGSFDSHGMNFALDSFDSRDPAWSTGGLHDSTKNRDNAELSLDEGLTNFLNFGNASIYGSVTVGPGAPVLIGSNGTVGDFAWITNMNSGIQPGKLSTDLNPHFPEARTPFTNGNPPLYNVSVTNIVVSGNTTNYVVTTYDTVFDDGDYIAPTISGKALVRGNARVFITGNISLSGGADGLNIETNASLEFYVAGAAVNISGQGIINQSGNATNFIYYGLPANTNVTLGGNASFTGVIYAPQAHIYLGGGGADTYDFIGAVVARSFRLNGHFRFHYDEALRELPFPK